MCACTDVCVCAARDVVHMYACHVCIQHSSRSESTSHRLTALTITSHDFHAALAHMTPSHARTSTHTLHHVMDDSVTSLLATYVDVGTRHLQLDISTRLLSSHVMLDGAGTWGQSHVATCLMRHTSLQHLPVFTLPMSCVAHDAVSPIHAMVSMFQQAQQMSW